jgi:hypothetical protein
MSRPSGPFCHSALLWLPPARNESVYGDPLVFVMVRISDIESPGPPLPNTIVQLGRVLVIAMPGVPHAPALQVPPEHALPPPPPGPPPPPPPGVLVVVVVVAVGVVVTDETVVVVAGGGDFRVVVPPPAVVVVFVEPPPLPGLPGLPPKPWFAGGTFSPGEGGDGGVIPGPEPLSGGRVGPVGGTVNAKLEIAPPPATAKRGISEAC